MKTANRRYIIAAAIGCAVGLLAIATAGTSSVNWLMRDESLIPHWDTYQNWTPGPLLDLEYKAVGLRICKIFLEQGFLYLAITISISCALAKLDELSTRRRWAWCLCSSLWVTFVGASAVGLIWSIGAVRVDTEVPRQSIPGQILYGYEIWLFLMAMAHLSLIAPITYVFFFIVFFFGTKSIAHSWPSSRKEVWKVFGDAWLNSVYEQSS